MEIIPSPSLPGMTLVSLSPVDLIRACKWSRFYFSDGSKTNWARNSITVPQRAPGGFPVYQYTVKGIKARMFFCRQAGHCARGALPVMQSPSISPLCFDLFLLLS